ncbi:MAG: phage holin family protein [Dehalococcoidia bacterium]
MAEPQQESRGERSLGELFGDLAQETTTLVRQEMLLARTELSQKATRLGKDVGFLAMGGAVAYAGFLALVAAVIIGLATLGLPWWLSSLVVGLVVAVVGYLLVQNGLSALRREDLAPRQTMETLGEDARRVKELTQ